MDFQDTQVKYKEPKNSGGGGKRNANIMSGGKVNPKSKLYQRSVANRESLANYLQSLWNEGKDEADVFMAGVNSLMRRGHGYVGAYLDSKNPGRVYKENEAMAITDAVMSKAGIGENPGKRLTRADDEESREERKVSNQLRGMTSPKVERGPKAMSRRQQRKQGFKQPSGPALPPGGEREGLGDREKGPVSEWQKTLEDAINGKASTSDVVKAFQKEKQSPLSSSPQAQAKRKKQESEDRARETAAPDEDMSPEEEGGISPTRVEIGDKFKELVKDTVEANMPINKDTLEGIVQETIQTFKEEGYEVDTEEVRTALFTRFNNKKFMGYDIKLEPPSSPERTEKRAPDAAPEPDEKQAPADAAPEPDENQAPADAAPEPSQPPGGGGFRGLLGGSQPASKPSGGGFGGRSRPSPEEVEQVMKAIEEQPIEETIKSYQQGNLFGGAGFDTGTSDTNPLEGGSMEAKTSDTERPTTPEATSGSLLEQDGSAKNFRNSGPTAETSTQRKPTDKKSTQRSIRGLGPSSGKFDTTRSKKSGDEMLTQNLRGYGFTPKQVKEIQKSGMTELERQTITRRLENTQELKSKRPSTVGEERGGNLLEQDGSAKNFKNSGPQKPKPAAETPTQRKPTAENPAPQPSNKKKTRGPLDQIAKTILDGIERDKAARRKRANRKKGTSNNAEYQEFAQSIRSMMR
jgi:hypothetical protein